MNEETPALSRRERMDALRRKNTYQILIGVAFFAGLLSGYLVWGRTTSEVAAADLVADLATPTEAPPPRRYEISTVGYPSHGPEDAEIVIVEFSDYQCPYCTKWHQEVYKQLLAEYPDQIRFVYRNFPLTSIHPDAMEAAQAALCAGDQGAYWDYHDKLFGAAYGLGMDAYQQYARELGLDAQSLVDCIESAKYEEYVLADMDFAINLGINSTPTFFINGLAVVGAQPLNVFKQVIEKELAGEYP
ncbi:MAG: DsbA family protein [Chloroflexota bacterium]